MRDAVFLPKLGPYVRVNQLRDGRLTAFMEVPKHLRPDGWPPTIQLPEVGVKAGKLSDMKFIERVRRDAERLKLQLDGRRSAERLRQRLSERSFPELIEAYQESIRFRKLVPERQYRNLRNAQIIAEWAASRSYVSFDQIGKREIEEFLMGYENRPSALLDMRSTWNVMCTEAIGLGWRRDNPAKSIRWKAPKPREAKLWEQEDVDAYAHFARKMGHPGLAVLLIVQFSAGQRSGDLRKAKHGANFNGEALTLKQSKTGARVRVPLPRDLCRLIEQARVPTSDFLFNDFETGGPFDNDGRLFQIFSAVRRAVVAHGGRYLTMQTLRHSAVCVMARAGLTLPQIAAVTGHLNVTVNAIIERYVVDRDGVGAEAMRQLNRHRGGRDEDFSDTKGQEYRDWLASSERAATANRVLIREERFDADMAAVTGQSKSRWGMPRGLSPWPQADDAMSLN